VSSQEGLNCQLFCNVNYDLRAGNVQSNIAIEVLCVFLPTLDFKVKTKFEFAIDTGLGIVRTALGAPDIVRRFGLTVNGDEAGTPG